MSRSPASGKKRSSGDWTKEKQQPSVSPEPAGSPREETRHRSRSTQRRRANSHVEGSDRRGEEAMSRSSNASTVRSMFQRTPSSQDPESSRRRCRRSSSFRDSSRPSTEVTDYVVHQSQPLDFPSPRRRPSHKKQRLQEKSSPPRPPRSPQSPQQTAGSPEREAKRMEPPKTVRRESRAHRRLESPPPPPSEESGSVASAPNNATLDEKATAGRSEEKPVASPAKFKKPTVSKASTAASSKVDANAAEEPAESDKDPAAATAPNFGLSGKLAAETNTVNGVVLKYAEPPEARKPKSRWRLYVFKDNKDIDMRQLDKASGYLFGRDRMVADVPTDHPSCSSQHAVLQFRQTTAGASSASSSTIKPYLIDLSSTNGTFLNGEKIPAQRYVELRSEDVIKFGFSTREYVLLSE
ncbi:hypothetical protein GGI10_001746 [Coemansia sp. RSA 2530]|nr:hypothetical protein GGI10_001746 [Coemansia sp. RSA 2530]